MFFSKIWLFYQKNLGTSPSIEYSRAKSFWDFVFFFFNLTILWEKIGNFPFNRVFARQAFFWDLVLKMWWFYEKTLEIFPSFERNFFEIQYDFLKNLTISWEKFGNFSSNWVFASEKNSRFSMFFSKIWWFYKENVGIFPSIECSRAKKKLRFSMFFLKNLMIWWIGNFPLNWVFASKASKKKLRSTRFFSKIWRFYEKNLGIFPLIECLRANLFWDLVCFLSKIWHFMRKIWKCNLQLSVRERSERKNFEI